MGAERRQVTVLFTDMVGFTTGSSVAALERMLVAVDAKCGVVIPLYARHLGLEPPADRMLELRMCPRRFSDFAGPISRHRWSQHSARHWCHWAPGANLDHDFAHAGLDNIRDPAVVQD
jgi:hypothetical protein